MRIDNSYYLNSKHKLCFGGKEKRISHFTHFAPKRRGPFKHRRPVTIKKGGEGKVLQWSNLKLKNQELGRGDQFLSREQKEEGVGAMGF